MTTPCPFCGQRFTTQYIQGNVYACQTLVRVHEPTIRTNQTYECLRGEVAKLGETVTKMKHAGDAMAHAEGCRCDDGVVCPRCAERARIWRKATEGVR